MRRTKATTHWIPVAQERKIKEYDAVKIEMTCEVYITLSYIRLEGRKQDSKLKLRRENTVITLA